MNYVCGKKHNKTKYLREKNTQNIAIIQDNP